MSDESRLLDPDRDRLARVAQVVLPVLGGTAIYWVVADATPVEAAIFAIVMAVTLVAIQYYLGEW